jgi:hypothetical protein
MDRAKVKELIDYLLDSDYPTDALEDLISDAAGEDLLFECENCEQIFTPLDEAVTNRRGRFCMHCDESQDIADSDEANYRSAKR